MITLPSQFLDEIRKSQQASPFVWLWTFVADTTTTATTTFYLARSDVPVTFGATTYLPYPISVPEITTHADGNLPSMAVVLANPGRLLSPYLAIGQGFIDTKATVILANKANLTGSAGTYISMSWLIADTVLSEDKVTFNLTFVNLNNIFAPSDRYNAQSCRHAEFGGPRCGYVLNSVAAFTTCGRTIANCIARGLDMKARGLPQLQPERFGGYVGIPLQR